ncbi:MAG: thiamine-phosphate kinase [Desulfobacterales bacterium]|nr:thiamine-phosphate kinase [Desulfobacterales bacterium]
MLKNNLKKALRFCFIADHSNPGISLSEQVKIAVQCGATIIRYKNDSLAAGCYNEIKKICDFCRCNFIPFIIHNNILLAKAVNADGIHIEGGEDSPETIRSILGDESITGISISHPVELKSTDIQTYDYIEYGPVFSGKKAIGLPGLKSIASESRIPVVVTGGIDETNAKVCFENFAAGISINNSIFNLNTAVEKISMLALICDCKKRQRIESPWDNEFALIEKLLESFNLKPGSVLKVPPGDDACLLSPLTKPVITTDTQKEGVHFRLDWQTPEEVGYKAVVITLSDLAASYAIPISIFINLTLPGSVSDKTINKFYIGIQKAIAEYSCTLGGGNISRGAKFSIDLFAIGEGNSIFPQRSFALEGEGLYSTGPLGLANAGLDSLLRDDLSFKTLIDKFKSPKARFDAAFILAEHNVLCVMDISDGLAGDAEHIAKASEVSIKFSPEKFIINQDLASYCLKYNLSPVELIFKGGEDYELLFTCSQDTFTKINKKIPASFQVGSCTPFSGKYLSNLPSGISSFQHGS